MMCQAGSYHLAEATTSGVPGMIGMLVEHISQPPTQPRSSRLLRQELPWQINPAIAGPPGTTNLGCLPSALVLHMACTHPMCKRAPFHVYLFCGSHLSSSKPCDRLHLIACTFRLPADQQDCIAGGAHCVARCAASHPSAQYCTLLPAGKTSQHASFRHTVQIFALIQQLIQMKCNAAIDLLRNYSCSVLIVRFSDC